MSDAEPVILYGYKIILPETDSSAFILDMYSIRDMLESPLQIYALVPHHDSMDGSEVLLILGFVPDPTLSMNLEYNESLHEFITDNPMLDGIEHSSLPRFYSGFEWSPDVVSDASSDESSDESSDVSSDASSDVSSEACSESSADDTEEEEEEEEEKQPSEDKLLQYYVSHYYI